MGTVHLRVSNGHYFSADEEKKVLIQRAGTGTFIQMDKPIYNPGQAGEHRVERPYSYLCLDLPGLCSQFPVRGLPRALCHVASMETEGSLPSGSICWKYLIPAAFWSDYLCATF